MTIEELADLVGVPVRTIRYYIAEDLLPGPGMRGKGTVYGEEHLARLRVIRMLVDQRVPLAEIRERLQRLSPSEINAILNEERQRFAEQERAAQSPRDYLSTLLRRARAGQPSSSPALPRQPSVPAEQAREAGVQMEPLSPPWQAPGGEEWRRWVLAPGVELHIRADAMSRHRGLIEQLLRVTRARGTRSEK